MHSVPPETATEPSTSIDMEASTVTLMAAVTSAVQDATKSPHLPTGKSPASERASTTMDPTSVEGAVSKQLALITSPTAGTKGPGSSGASHLHNSEKRVFPVLPLNWEEAFQISSRPKFGPMSMWISVS